MKLRAERAQLLGYESHAHWRMSDTMAVDPKCGRVHAKVWPAHRARQSGVADMQAIADREKTGTRIEPWDYLY